MLDKTHSTTPSTTPSTRDVPLPIPDTQPDPTTAPTRNTRTAPDTSRTSVTTDTETRPDSSVGTRDTHTTTGQDSQTGARPGADAKDTDGAKYDLLVARERNDPAGALSGYLELSKGNSKWAGVALFAAGRLAADRNDRRAVTFLDIYLRRFPNGANADDARNLLARLKGDAL